ncbi:MAG: GNAT family N-acetyltransferase [Gemmatimonadetes bacterium]|nr:GNAT family N-acetyltransferase [Gemmatimonadota bacterium]MBI2401832.1 GNAT family N-acetyltransferase [Gemmatimonadota bacterium]
MVRRCEPADFASVLAVINDGARAYKGKIPADCWKEPYMPAAELQEELAAGVVFSACTQGQEIVAVMGLQDVADVTLIRHAYTRTTHQHHGYGSALLEQLRAQTQRPILIGTWKAATWAVRFYERHGFRLVSEAEKRVLLRRYWTVPGRQIQESVVLVDDRWRARA